MAGATGATGATGGGAETLVLTGGGVTGGRLVSSGGRLVSNGGRVLVSSSGGWGVSSCRWQPWISMVTSPAAPATTTHETASFMRERRLLYSKREPCGTNGLGVLMLITRMASFLRGEQVDVVDGSAAKFSLGKFHGGLNSFHSSAQPGKCTAQLTSKGLTPPPGSCKAQNAFFARKQRRSSQLQCGQGQHRAQHAQNKETHDHLRFVPALFLEMMVQRRHQKNPSAGARP